MVLKLMEVVVVTRGVAENRLIFWGISNLFTPAKNAHFL